MNMVNLMDELNYWVFGLEKIGLNPDGSTCWKPREGFTLEECLQKMNSMRTGTLESLQEMIDQAKREEDGN